MFEWFRSGTISNGEPLPDYLFSVCPWLLYASNWYSDSWVNGLDADKKLKLIDKLANDAPFVRQFGARETAPAQPETPARVEPEKPAEQPRVEPPPPAAETYTIQGGDTLSAIGRKFNVSVAALVAANDIENPSLIRPGQALKIPRA
ncbi:MAG: hypothetical protein B6D41_16620 [Chloroflexi bacterium UTCFX4]|nr:MAG: hypothetical protein B6D41_16620 [Chloroflexi bacterium UTCFX4]